MSVDVFNPISRPPQLLQPVRILRGWDLARRRKRDNPTEAALLAADLAKGRTSIDHLTPGQAIDFTGADPRDFTAAYDLTPTERTAVEAGRVWLVEVAMWKLRLKSAA